MYALVCPVLDQSCLPKVESPVSSSQWQAAKVPCPSSYFISLYGGTMERMHTQDMLCYLLPALAATAILAKTDLEGCTSFTSTVTVDPSPEYGNTYETDLSHSSQSVTCFNQFLKAPNYPLRLEGLEPSKPNYDRPGIESTGPVILPFAEKLLGGLTFRLGGGHESLIRPEAETT
ncbi:hypothetical protein LZ30DRAFT_796675 [Colletotrichum cereale]|nr:hypothetical protein LZ30DRAFT_796675 [Colletotrichum cereale]